MTVRELYRRMPAEYKASGINEARKARAMAGSEGWEGAIPSGVLAEAQSAADASGLAMTVSTASDFAGRFWEHSNALGFSDMRQRGCNYDSLAVITLLPSCWYD